MHKTNKSGSMELLKSSFNLRNEKIKDSKINKILATPIVKDIDSNDDGNKLDWYVNYMEVDVCNEKYNSFKKKGARINEIIRDKTGLDKRFDIVKSAFVRNSKTDTENGETRFLAFYPSNKKENKKLRLDDYVNKSFIIKSIIDIHINLNILIKTASDNNIESDSVTGDLLMGIKPHSKTTKEGKTECISGFRMKTTYDDGILKVNINLRAYSIVDLNDITVNDGVTTSKNIGKYKDEKAIDKLFSRDFININSSEFVRSKLGVLQMVFNNTIEVLEKLNINYEIETFKADRLFNDFINDSDLNVSFDCINIFVKNEDIEKLEEDGDAYAVKLMVKYIENTFNLKCNLVYVSNNEYQDTSGGINLFLDFLFGGNGYVRKLNKKTGEYDVSKNCFFDVSRKINEIVDYDLYTKTKALNYLKTINDGNKDVTQGFIIEKVNKYMRLRKPLIGDDKESKDEVLNLDGVDYLMKKSFKMKIQKTITELDLKNRVSNLSFIDFKNNKYNNIKLFYKGIKRVKKERRKIIIESYIEMEKEGDGYRIIDSQVTEYNDGESSNTSKKTTNYSFLTNEKLKDIRFFMLVDDSVLISKETESMSTIVCSAEAISNNQKNPLYISKELADISNLTDKERMLTRASIDSSNMFYPYVSRVTAKLVEDSSKLLNKSNSFLLVQGCNGDYQTFLRSNETAMNSTVDKQTLLDSFKIYDYVNYELELKKDSDDYLKFFASSMTFNILKIKQASKKSIFEKMVELMISN